MTRLPASTSQPLLPPLDCRRRHRCCCCCCISLLQSSVPVSLASAYLPVAVLVSSRSLLPCLSSAGQQRRLRQSAERRLCLRRLRTSHPDPRPHVRRRPAEQLRCRRSRAVCRFSCCQVASRTQRSPRGQYTQRARALSLSLSPSLALADCWCCAGLPGTQVCREYQRGNCKRSAEDCRFAHPPDHVHTDAAEGLVTVCMDFVKGRCSRDACRYLHPPPHLQSQMRCPRVPAAAQPSDYAQSPAAALFSLHPVAARPASNPYRL